MENTISALLEMDRQARATVDAARMRSEQIVLNAVKKSESIEAEGRKSLEKQTMERFSSIKASSDKEISRIENKAAEKCAALDKIMSDKKKKWKKEILERILNGESL